MLLDVARVAKAHGVRGEVIVELLTNRPERVAAGVVLESDRGALKVEASRPHQHRWIVAFEGVVDRTGAEALHGLVLRAEPLEEPDTLWVHELVGSEVTDVAGNRLGAVTAVEANPASDLLVIDGATLVPLRFVVSSSPGHVVVDPPAGLLEL